ncbi:proprotein convertase P-domain-containing protein [Roseospira goensis]|uniref:Subtilisin-like proprotein convertase family protein n=1 Tax=Roseospira goensis TaxID=391922 RepID=A0A7W6WL95_9PROT|nr:proprotein convertase P-domain-containing protein [Roseospira goensis]MBB4286453.1 subtilisin-like proprotein convertase family protein [Roseospira goensis]
MGNAGGQGTASAPVVAVLDQGIGFNASVFAAAMDAPIGSHGATVARVLLNTATTPPAGGVRPLDIALSSAQLGASFADLVHGNLDVDVFAASWGVSRMFGDDFAGPDYAGASAALDRALTEGRDGKGSVFVFAAGNRGDDGDNVNHHNFQNDPGTIAVGAVDALGAAADFSTPGAAVLLSARGVDVPVDPGNPGAGTVTGTSFAAPQVAAAVSDMLAEAPELGYRDVQTILAATAQPTGGSANAADTFNGGGLTFDPNIGFGVLDHAAAVRLADAWQGSATAGTLQHGRAAITGSAAIPDGGGGPLVIQLGLDAPLSVEHVSLGIDLEHDWIGDLTIDLVSPEGTRSRLLDRPGQAPGSASGSSDDDIDFTLTSAQFRGETAAGVWTIEVTDHGAGFDGTLTGISLDVEGAAASADDTYVFTDAFATLGGQPGRATVVDDDGGRDALQAAALSGDAHIDLTDGAVSWLAGRAVTTWGLDDAYGGAGHDMIVGTETANLIYGGLGNDTLHGGGGADTFDVSDNDGHDVVQDFDGHAGDRLAGRDDGGGFEVMQGEDGVILQMADGSSVELQGVSAFDADWFLA